MLHSLSIITLYKYLTFYNLLHKTQANKTYSSEKVAENKYLKAFEVTHHHTLKAFHSPENYQLFVSLKLCDHYSFEHYTYIY